MSLLDILTGGKSGEASDYEKQALDALGQVQTPTLDQLTLPELEEYAKAQNMTPAQMQAFLQQSNALEGENVDQTGTSAQEQALAQLSDTAHQGAEGDATERAQQSQIQQDMGRTLAGQRGAIDQQAQARGVPLGLLQAALSQQNAGQDLQNANQLALTAQSNNYQTALNALAQQGTLGNSLQGQQNNQANTVANASNAMQQFNAANQQGASAANAGYQQQANAANTAAANQVSQANTGLKNQQIQYNAQVPETMFNNSMQKASGIANQSNNAAQNATGQGQQNAGIYAGLLGAGATALGSPAAQAVPKATQVAPKEDTSSYYYNGGEVCMQNGGPVPGHAKVHGNSPMNDTVHAKLSPGEAVIPRTTVQSNPQLIHQLLAQSQQQPEGHNPQDVATLLAAMKHLRGGGH